MAKRIRYLKPKVTARPCDIPKKAGKKRRNTTAAAGAQCEGPGLPGLSKLTPFRLDFFLNRGKEDKTISSHLYELVVTEKLVCKDKGFLCIGL